jgi:hypothetical protein
MTDRIPQSIAVDFDKTLAVYTEWKGAGVLGEPIMPMVNRVKQWLAEGKIVKIFTARVWHDDTPRRLGEALASRVAIEDWCEKYFGQRLEVTCEKDIGILEIWDDRAVQVIPNTGIVVEEENERLKDLLKRIHSHFDSDFVNPGEEIYGDGSHAGKYLNSLLEEIKAELV